MATASISDLLAAAFSSTLNTKVVTYDQYKKEKSSQQSLPFEALNIDQLFKLSHIHGRFGDVRAEEDTEAEDKNRIQIFVKGITGNQNCIDVFENALIKDVKESVEYKTGIPSADQRFIHGGRALEDGKTVSDYDIKNGSVIFLVIKLPGGGMPNYYIDDSLLDPGFDYDFTDMKNDGKKYYRGGYEYHRPYGWKRYALKVLGTYGDNKWLGMQGIRQESSEGEWPVSYHGTDVNVSGSIAQEGYDLSEGKRFLFGKGIYSSPSIEVAIKYAKTFEYEGKKYRILFQNRVSTNDLKVVDAKTTGVGEYWVQPHQELIRPYGVCIQLV